MDGPRVSCHSADVIRSMDGGCMNGRAFEPRCNEDIWMRVPGTSWGQTPSPFSSEAQASNGIWGDRSDSCPLANESRSACFSHWNVYFWTDCGYDPPIGRLSHFPVILVQVHVVVNVAAAPCPSSCTVMTEISYIYYGLLSRGFIFDTKSSNRLI